MKLRQVKEAEITFGPAFPQECIDRIDECIAREQPTLDRTAYFQMLVNDHWKEGHAA